MRFIILVTSSKVTRNPMYINLVNVVLSIILIKMCLVLCNSRYARLRFYRQLPLRFPLCFRSHLNCFRMIINRLIISIRSNVITHVDFTYVRYTKEIRYMKMKVSIGLATSFAIRVIRILHRHSKYVLISIVNITIRIR